MEIDFITCPNYGTGTDTRMEVPCSGGLTGSKGTKPKSKHNQDGDKHASPLRFPRHGFLFSVDVSNVASVPDDFL